MSEDHNTLENRRRFLKIVGSGAVLAPVVLLAACSGGDDAAPPAAAPKAASKPANETAKPMDSAARPVAVPAASGGMPRLAEDDPQAKSLAYVHEATSLDSTKQPRYQPGQVCANCALYQGKAGDEWGGCSIFPGKHVKASGWCSVYAPKPG